MTRAEPIDYARLRMDPLDSARLSLREAADQVGVTLTIAREAGGSADEIAALEARKAQLLAAAASEHPMDVVEAWEDMHKCR